MSNSNNNNRKLIILATILIILDIIVGIIGVIGIGSPRPIFPTPSVCPVSPSSPCPTNMQASNFSCSFSASSTCAHTVTFSPTFSVTPTLHCCPMIMPNTGLPIFSLQVADTAFVAAGNGTRDNTWANMPGFALTELFGDTLGQHRKPVDFTGSQTMTLIIACPVATVNMLDFLVPQYSNDGGVTWKYFDTGTTSDGGVFDAFIDGVSSTQGNCATAIPVNTNDAQNNPHSIIADARGKELVRIMGQTFGSGDSPVFTEISVATFTNIQVTCFISLLQLTNFNFQTNIICSDKISLNIQVYWEAFILA